MRREGVDSSVTFVFCEEEASTKRGKKGRRAGQVRRKKEWGLKCKTLIYAKPWNFSLASYFLLAFSRPHSCSRLRARHDAAFTRKRILQFHLQYNLFSKSFKQHFRYFSSRGGWWYSSFLSSCSKRLWTTTTKTVTAVSARWSEKSIKATKATNPLINEKEKYQLN